VNGKRMIVRDLQEGDLVNHILYGGTWIGVIVNFREEIVGTTNMRRVQALVQVQPGTEFEGFFKRSSKADRVNDNLGYVSVHWLFKIEEKNGNTGPSRGKTPSRG
jgi:hypothetical protein